MKIKLLALAVITAFSMSNLSAQEDKSKRKSPPATMETTVGDAKIVINYSQPSMSNREIYGKLVPFGEVWRTGANEATTFKTSKDITVNGKKLPAGTYSVFTIPNADEWTIIFNSEPEQWGAYKYDESKDVIRVKAEPVKVKKTEKMTFSSGKEGVIYLDWAETRVPFMIKA